MSFRLYGYGDVLTGVRTENPLWHTTYGFSPVWVLICVSRSPERLNLFWHTWHSYVFSPVWMRRCIIRLEENSKPILKHLALVWFFTSMNAAMCWQAWRFRKSFVANITCVWLLTSMGSHVFLKVSSPSKSLLTYMALICLFTCMDAAMIWQAWGCWKSFVANITCVWLFTSMHHSNYGIVFALKSFDI